MSEQIQNKILLKRGQSAPGTILETAEPGYDLKNKRLYIGNGVGNAPTAIPNEAYISSEIAKAQLSGTADLSAYATKEFVKSQILLVQGGWQIDLSEYSKKEDLEQIDFPVDSINGKTGAVQLSATDVGALPIDGGHVTGALDVNGGVVMWKDIEGGNIRVYPPSNNTYTDYWEMDSYNGGELRFYASRKSTNTNGSGLVFPLRMLTDGSISTGNNDKTRKNLGVAPATAPSNYPSCYYRTVDGEIEWINPPMAIGTEYRTTERYNGKPVYAKLVNYGTMPNNTQKSIAVSCTGVTMITYAEGVAVHSAGVTHVPLGGHLAVAIVTEIFSNNITLTLQASTDFSAWSAYILLKYIKN